MDYDLDKARQQEQLYLMANYSRLPVLFTHGHGTRLWDDTGREYVDFVSGLGACVAGHCHAEIIAAVARQVSQLIHVTNLYYTRPQGELAEMLARYTFADKAFFCNSGTEANEAAIKLARKYMRDVRGEDRYEVVSAFKSFHGRTYGSLAATGQPEKAEPFHPLPPGFVHVPFNDLAAMEEAVDAQTCAVILEPIQGEGGVYVADPPYLKGVWEICRRNGALLILDEVQTGMGRTGALFAHEHYAVTPDVMTVAKGLAGGLPIGALLASADAAQGFAPGDHGSTFGGNPVVCAAALAVMTILQEEQLVENASRVGAYFMHSLLELQRSSAAISEVRGMGLMLAAELKESVAKETMLSCLERGYVINNIGDNILRFLPPLSISTREVDGLIEVLGGLLAGGRQKGISGEA
ncbi:MAG: acetylornithine transaminase [Actinobacteria bacterium]|jgi:predicted acetylornithine/succinylornithine family transaminase|nr:MAG: acetylornithine transaminase [Actinomycetota bacterium]